MTDRECPTCDGTGEVKAGTDCLDCDGWGYEWPEIDADALLNLGDER